MATHLAEQARKRHEDYLKAEVSSLRMKLTETEEELRAVNLRLLLVERSLAHLGREPV